MCKLYNNINEMCKQRKSNITQMCKQLDIPRSILSELKAERTKSLTTEVLCKIADYLECPIDYLLGRIEMSDSLPSLTNRDSINQNEQLVALINIFSSLDPVNQAKLLVYADELKKQSAKNK